MTRALQNDSPMWKARRRFLHRAHMHRVWENWIDHKPYHPTLIVYWRGFMVRLIEITAEGEAQQRFSTYDTRTGTVLCDRNSDAAWSRWFFEKLDLARRARRMGEYDLAHAHLRDARNFRKQQMPVLHFRCEGRIVLEAAE